MIKAECISDLPSELRLRVLSLLPPNELALAGRLSSRDAAQRFSSPDHRTARLRQPLPGHVTAAGTVPGEGVAQETETSLGPIVQHASRFLFHLTFKRKLMLLSTAAASGCAANVEFAWQLLQPHVFPELMQTDLYLDLLQREISRSKRGDLPLDMFRDVGSAAVAGGLVHLLPSLAQRFPGLLDPARTLEAAARHCDLAGLQAAWDAVGHRLLSSQECADGQGSGTGQQQQQWAPDVHGAWRYILSAAAGSPGPDAEAKMEWVVGTARPHSGLGVGHAEEVWGAAAASGDLARLRWLRECGIAWGGAEALAAVLRHADLDFIVRMEQEGGYLPPVGDLSWSTQVAPAAAASPCDSAAKMSWLAGRGVDVGTVKTVKAAAQHGNLDALQLAVQHWGQQQQHEQEEAGNPAPPREAMWCAVWSGHLPTAAWLHQAGCALGPRLMSSAAMRGDVPMVRWLVEAGCPFEDTSMSDIVLLWPSHTPADGEQLAEALALLAAAGMPARLGNDQEPHVTAMSSGQPRAVWRALQQQLLPAAAAVRLPNYVVESAITTGCEASLKALAELGALSGDAGWHSAMYYGAAAKSGDRCTLALLQRLGLPMAKGTLAMAMVSKKPPLPALRWLVEHGAPAGRNEVSRALHVLQTYRCDQQQRHEVAAWLRGLNGSIWDGLPCFPVLKSWSQWFGNRLLGAWRLVVQQT